MLLSAHTGETGWCIKRCPRSTLGLRTGVEWKSLTSETKNTKCTYLVSNEPFTNMFIKTRDFLLPVGVYGSRWLLWVLGS